jgi:uncharacterized protein
MKYLVLLAVLVIAYLVWRNGRIERRQSQRRGPGAPPQEMVGCSACGLHLPQGDALRGADGRYYCCNEHRQRAGR